MGRCLILALPTCLPVLPWIATTGPPAHLLQVVLMEGEALLNDASAVTLYTGERGGPRGGRGQVLVGLDAAAVAGAHPLLVF